MTGSLPAAILQMSLADGLAAIFGIRYGGRHRYSVYGYGKSIIGTVTFFVISLGILLGVHHWGTLDISLAAMVSISLLATLLENFAVHGFDNLLVPVLVALLLVTL